MKRDEEGRSAFWHLTDVALGDRRERRPAAEKPKKDFSGGPAQTGGLLENRKRTLASRTPKVNLTPNLQKRNMATHEGHLRAFGGVIREFE